MQPAPTVSTWSAHAELFDNHVTSTHDDDDDEFEGLFGPFSQRDCNRCGPWHTPSHTIKGILKQTGGGNYLPVISRRYFPNNESDAKSLTVTERSQWDQGAQQLSLLVEPVRALSWVEPVRAHPVQCPRRWWQRNGIHKFSVTGFTGNWTGGHPGICSQRR